MIKLEEELTNTLDTCIQEYVNLFCNKHDMELDFWVADLSGTVGSFGDYFFGFEDIRLDLETNQPEEEIFKWYEANLELGMKNQSGINYYSWIKGYRPEDNVFETKNLSTDDLFKALPSFVNVDGDFYHFSLVKGLNRIIVCYQMNQNEGGKCLENTNRSGKTTKDALKSMLDWLIQFGYYNKKSENILLDMIKKSKK